MMHRSRTGNLQYDAWRDMNYQTCQHGITTPTPFGLISPPYASDCGQILVHSSASAVQIDEQDAEERAELRRKQIESANKMLYDDTDRPKKLHSKMLLSDVMQERVAQMDYAQQIKALKQKQDADFLVQQTARLKVIELKLHKPLLAHLVPNSPTCIPRHLLTQLTIRHIPLIQYMLL